MADLSALNETEPGAADGHATPSAPTTLTDRKQGARWLDNDARVEELLQVRQSR